MTGYRELFRWRGVTKIIMAQMVSRLPIGMLSLTLLLYVESLYNDYFLSAGIVLAFLSGSQAIFSPLVARLTNIWSADRVLIVTACITAALLAGLGLSRPPLWLTLVLATSIGASIPPIQSVVRTLYPDLVPNRLKNLLFSADAIVQEIIWVLGPVIVTVLAVVFTPSLTMLLSALLLFIGTVWLALCHQIRTLNIPPAASSVGVVLRNPVVSIISLLGLLIIGACNAIEVSVVAIFKTGGDGHQLSIVPGIVLAVWSMGSLAGGFTFGHRTVKRWSLTMRMIPFLVGLVLALFWNDAVWISMTLFISGMGIAPIISASYSYISAATTPATSPEAFAWLNSGQLIGSGIFSALTGMLIKVYSPSAGLVLAAAALVISGIIAAASRNILPDLSKQGGATVTAPITLPINLRP